MGLPTTVSLLLDVVISMQNACLEELLENDLLHFFNTERYDDVIIL
jgi:hypothetical protein